MKVSLSEGMWQLWYLILIFSVLYVCFLFCTFATVRLMFPSMQGGTSCGNSHVSRGMPFMFPLSCQVGILVYYSKIPCNFIAPRLHFHKEQQLRASALDIWSIWRTELSCFAYEWWQCNILGEILCSFKAAVALSDRCVGTRTQVHTCQSFSSGRWAVLQSSVRSGKSARVAVWIFWKITWLTQKVLMLLFERFVSRLGLGYNPEISWVDWCVHFCRCLRCEALWLG